MGKRTKSLIKFLLQTFYGKWDFYVVGKKEGNRKGMRELEVQFLKKNR